MRFTTLGKEMADKPADTNLTGASAHVEAVKKDDGLKIVLTGSDYAGKRFTKTAGSVSAAFFTMSAVGGLRNAWLVKEDGSRRLLIARY